MPTNVNDIIKKLPPAQRKRIEKRAAALIAEEMTLRQLAARGNLGSKSSPGP
jgi:hypothetical protein